MGIALLDLCEGSTSDRDQNVETQLLPLREFAAAQRFEVAGEYVD